MFSIEEYYAAAHSGEKVNNDKVLEYIKSFPKVVLWGGSYLGEAVGKYLLEQGVPIDAYWDIRADTLKVINGIPCVLPFESQDKGQTLIVFCIANNVINHVLLSQLKQKGYNNVIRGDYLYMGAICPFDKTTGIDASICQGTMCCRAVYCQRINGILKNRCNTCGDPLHLVSVTFIINQRCSLKCKCCTSYMNEYALEDRIDIPLNRICEDIDRFFDAIDSVGTVTVMGGEPFMHPDISQIIKKMLTKDNLGLISIATSGTWPIKPEQLEGLDDKRVNVSFSNYEQSITRAQTDVMHKSIETVRNAGISYTVGITMPEWVVPTTLYDLGYTEQQMIEKKKACTLPPRAMQVKDGKLHPCDYGTALYSLGLGKYENSYVDIAGTSSKEDLRKKIQEYMKQPYYRVCGHCNSLGLMSKAAEQGYLDFKKPLSQDLLDGRI